jgi:hypothetical protein
VATVILRAAVLGFVGVLLLAPAALGDTCCANTPVEFHPRSATPGDVVRVSDVQCLNSDNSGPLPLRLVGFWLSPGSRAADADPETAPGPGTPANMPEPATWPAFDGVTPAGTGSGTATFIVPQLRSGTYQLWWLCDNNGGPGSGIHYGTGDRLKVEGLPATSTAPSTMPMSSDAPWSMPLVLFALASSALASIALRLRVKRGKWRA